MPNRVLKDSITCSKQIDSLTWFQEVMFYRLIVKADDFGRYHADPQIVKSELFPRKEDLTKKAVAEGLDALEACGLIKRYAWEEADYLQIVKWEDHQQRRATKSKFPDVNGNHVIANSGNRNQMKSIDINCNQLQSNDNNRNQMSPNTNTNTNTKTKTNNAREESADAFASDEELFAIQKDHDQILDSAKRIGLPLTEKNCDDLIGLYEVYGLEAVLHGIKEAGEYNKISIAYIRKVAANYGNEKPKSGDDWEDNVMKSVVWG